LLQTAAWDLQWFVVRTKAKKEDYAVQQLERRGVAAFLPRVIEYGRDQIAPLFPGYLFVHIELLAQYYRVVWAPGVRSFVAFGEVPTPVQDNVVNLIRASAIDGIIRPLSPFKPGDRVQIRAGRSPGSWPSSSDPARHAAGSKSSSTFSGRASAPSCRWDR